MAGVNLDSLDGQMLGDCRLCLGFVFGFKLRRIDSSHALLTLALSGNSDNDQNPWLEST